jgi:C4-dicarboxylate-specific signal transduction histidine kinase
MELTQLQKTLNRLYPFHLIFSHEGELRSFGRSAEKCFTNIQIGMLAKDLLNPVIPKDIDPISQARSLSEKVVTIESSSTKTRLNGEVIILDESHEILFALSPVIQNLANLADNGLSYRDFPAYSPVFDFFVLIQAERFARQELQKSFKSLEELNSFARINIEIANFCSRTSDLHDAVEYIINLLNSKLSWKGSISNKDHKDCHDIQYSEDGIDICLSSEKDKYMLHLESNQKITPSESLKFFCTSLKISLENVILRMEQLASDQEIQAQKVMSSKMFSLGEMAASIAHELNNPMAVIQGMAWMTQSSAQSGEIDSEKTIESMTKIIKMTERSSKIIKGIRIFARDAAQDPMDPIELNSIIEDTLELCKWRINQKGIKIIWQTEDAALSTGRSVQISQVLLNLLNNASDAVEGSQDPWIEVKLFQNDQKWIISVTDSGNGIDQNISKKMMNPFFTTKPSGKGTGLGLSISQRILKDHLGEIWYDEKSKNTRFCLSLPVLSE